jgi:hypothetical protein
MLGEARGHTVRFSAGRWIGVALAFLALPASTQTAPSADEVTLDGILMRLQIHHWEYVREVPDFFADEVVYSDLNGLRINGMRTVTQSVFRLRRGNNNVFPPELFETRVVRSSSGDSASGNTLTGPSILIGAFSNGLSTVTLAQKRCFDFRLASHRDFHHIPVFQIDYRLKPEMVATGICGPWQGIHGYAIVDAASFEILSLQMQVPHYLIVTGVHGTWRWWVDYAPVILDGRQFYIPKKIQSQAESDDGRMTWGFVASYRNYHKTGVSSRIITNLDEGAAPRPPSTPKTPAATSR